MPKTNPCPLKPVLTLLLGSIIAIGSANAQELIAIKVEPAEVSVGKPVQITVELKASSVANGACGLLVNFGDGTSQQIRAENNSLPIRLTRTYANVGSAAVTAEGKLYARGLSSVLGCFGKNQTVAVNVRPEDPSEREAAEIAAKNQAVKRAAEDRKAAEQAQKAAATDRAASEAAAQKAKAERAAADSAAKKAAANRIVAEQNAANSAKANPPPPPVLKPPAAAAAVGKSEGTSPPPTTTKPNQPKPKSSLDL